jgi:hypothetical protein
MKPDDPARSHLLQAIFDHCKQPQWQHAASIAILALAREPGKFGPQQKQDIFDALRPLEKEGLDSTNFARAARIHFAGAKEGDWKALARSTCEASKPPYVLEQYSQELDVSGTFSLSLLKEIAQSGPVEFKISARDYSARMNRRRRWNAQVRAAQSAQSLVPPGKE